MKFSRSRWPNGDTPTKHTQKKTKADCEKFSNSPRAHNRSINFHSKALQRDLSAEKCIVFKWSLALSWLRSLTLRQKKSQTTVAGSGRRRGTRQFSRFKQWLIDTRAEKRRVREGDGQQNTIDLENPFEFGLLAAGLLYFWAGKEGQERGKNERDKKKAQKIKSWMKMTKQFHLFFVGCPQPPTSIVARTLNRVIFTRPQPSRVVDLKAKALCVRARVEFVKHHRHLKARDGRLKLSRKQLTRLTTQPVELESEKLWNYRAKAARPENGTHKKFPIVFVRLLASLPIWLWW